MDIFTGYLIGLLGGFILAYTVTHMRDVSGVLKIDCTNSKKDKYRFEIDDLTTLSKKKRIILKIDATADLSQE